EIRRVLFRSVVEEGNCSRRGQPVARGGDRGGDCELLARIHRVQTDSDVADSGPRLSDGDGSGGRAFVVTIIAAVIRDQNVRAASELNRLIFRVSQAVQRVGAGVQRIGTAAIDTIGEAYGAGWASNEAKNRRGALGILRVVYIGPEQVQVKSTCAVNDGGRIYWSILAGDSGDHTLHDHRAIFRLDGHARRRS